MSSLAATQTLTCLPVLSLCSSSWDEIMLVVLSQSAAVPAPQQLENIAM